MKEPFFFFFFLALIWYLNFGVLFIDNWVRNKGLQYEYDTLLGFIIVAFDNLVNNNWIE